MREFARPEIDKFSRLQIKLRFHFLCGESLGFRSIILIYISHVILFDDAVLFLWSPRYYNSLLRLSNSHSRFTWNLFVKIEKNKLSWTSTVESPLIFYGKCNLYKKLHDMKFNYHLITSILKSQNSVAQRNNYSVVQISYWFSDGLVCKKVEKLSFIFL